jgi:hypothetical protein
MQILDVATRILATQAATNYQAAAPPPISGHIGQKWFGFLRVTFSISQQSE